MATGTEKWLTARGWLQVPKKIGQEIERPGVHRNIYGPDPDAWWRPEWPVYSGYGASPQIVKLVEAHPDVLAFLRA